MGERFTPLDEGTSLGPVPIDKGQWLIRNAQTRVSKSPPPVVWDEGPKNVGVEPNNPPLLGGALDETTRSMDAT